MNWPVNSSRTQIRLLHLEDDPWFRCLLEAALGLYGAPCDVMPVESVCDAIAALNSCLNEGAVLPDLLLLDLKLGDGDGLEVLHFAKWHPVLARIPTVMLGAELPPEVVQAALGLGASACWIKPKHPDSLREIAGRLLGLLQVTPAMQAV